MPRQRSEFEDRDRRSICIHVADGDGAIGPRRGRYCAGDALVEFRQRLAALVVTQKLKNVERLNAEIAEQNLARGGGVILVVEIDYAAYRIQGRKNCSAPLVDSRFAERARRVVGADGGGAEREVQADTMGKSESIEGRLRDHRLGRECAPAVGVEG